MEAHQLPSDPTSPKVSTDVAADAVMTTSPPAAQPRPDGTGPTLLRPVSAIPARRGRVRRTLWWTLGIAGLAASGYFLVPWVVTALNTVSTDDAYVNGHVTFVAPRHGAGCPRPGR